MGTDRPRLFGCCLMTTQTYPHSPRFHARIKVSVSALPAEAWPRHLWPPDGYRAVVSFSVVGVSGVSPDGPDVSEVGGI